MIKDLINAISKGDSLAIEDTFNAVMASKISERLDDMRVDVAHGMFGSVVEESYDSSDAYETWDPKHPKFKEKLIKHQKNGGTTKSFIEKEKAKAWKKLTRESIEDYSLEEVQINEYWAKGNVNGKQFHIKTDDDYSHSQIHKQNPHLSSAEAKAVHAHTNTDKFIDGEHHTQKHGSHTVSVHDNGGHFGESVEFEQLDELSKKTLGSYVKKATTNAIISGEALGKGEKWSKSGRIASKREKGIGKAIDKLTKEEFALEDYSVEELEDFMMSEEFEQLDEISKKTLGSYVNKAHNQLMTHTAAVNMKTGRGDKDAFAYSHDTDTMRKEKNRKKGLSQAVGKLTKEEVEELDELSTRTHISYRGKSTAKSNNLLKKVGTNPEWPIPTKDILHSAREKMSPEDQKVFDKRRAGTQRSYKKTGLGAGSAAHNPKSSDRHSGL